MNCFSFILFMILYSFQITTASEKANLNILKLKLRILKFAIPSPPPPPGDVNGSRSREQLTEVWQLASDGKRDAVCV